jgi:predicted RNase H-like HicB family nuclease
MLTRYIRAAMGKAVYTNLDDGSVYGEIPPIQGVWANAATREETERELQEVLEDWLMLNLEDHLPIPDIDGVSLQHERAA